MKSLDRRLTAAFGEFIRKRDPACVICGDAPTECCHLFAGRRAGTRWDTRCAFGMCHRCHMSQHQDRPHLLRDYAIDRYGQEVYDSLLRLDHKVMRWSESEKRDILKGLG